MNNTANVHSITDTTLLPSIQSTINTQGTVMMVVLLATLISWFFICIPDWILYVPKYIITNVPWAAGWLRDNAEDFSSMISDLTGMDLSYVKDYIPDLESYK